MRLIPKIQGEALVDRGIAEEVEGGSESYFLIKEILNLK
jgi:hypothetical protein